LAAAIGSLKPKKGRARLMNAFENFSRSCLPSTICSRGRRKVREGGRRRGGGCSRVSAAFSSLV